MTAGKNGRKATVQATVQPDGKVQALGQLYWSPPMQKYAGWQVELRVFGDGGPVQVWSGHHFLCSADVIADPGFGYPDVAAETAGKLRERADRQRALVVRGQAALLVELLADTVEDTTPRRSGTFHARYRGFQFFIQLLPIVGKHAIERERHRDLECAQRREARLRLAQSIFDLPYTIHGRRPSCEIGCDGEQAKPAAEAGHCLSEVAK
jgi:hypothetical protein